MWVRRGLVFLTRTSAIVYTEYRRPLNGSIQCSLEKSLCLIEISQYHSTYGGFLCDNIAAWPCRIVQERYLAYQILLFFNHGWCCCPRPDPCRVSSSHHFEPPLHRVESRLSCGEPSLLILYCLYFVLFSNQKPRYTREWCD